jgi:hypothetical protein
MERDFELVLRRLQADVEQKSLQKRDAMSRFKALGLALIFGVLVAGVTTSVLVGAGGWSTAVLGASALLAIFSWERATIQSIQAAKEQDRRYFLSCLRNAQSIDELNRAGLFAYFPDSQGPAWVVQVKGEVVRLRRALHIEPDWFDSV